MSLFRRVQTRASGTQPIPAPGARPLTGSVRVTTDTAMRHSAVWACLRLRADLISTMPIDVFRKVNGVRVAVPTPPVLRSPGGDRVDIQEWLYSTQVDLDRAGNCFGVITERNALGLPARIDLVQLGEVGVTSTDGEITYRIGGEIYRPEDVWHEKQYTVAGLVIGLSPIAYAAWSIGSYLSAQDFAIGWFGNSAIPAAELINTEKTITSRDASVAKTNYEASVRSGGLFVHGKDWELKPMQAVDSQTRFLEMMQYGIPDISRFFGCPADLIDGAVSGQAVTYANISQRNLQLLIMNLGAPVMRRESALSKLTQNPRYVKLNRSALLAMDPETRARTIKLRIESKTLTNTEARGLDDLAPLTDAEIAEFERLYGAPRMTPTEAKA
ncbi:phage portal protein [Micromonospora zamorensis]|uniref:phage portal protein n=1 Tax=Micromonospora zamorensis TaxID=709883 RepID=UPI0037237F99